MVVVTSCMQSMVADVVSPPSFPLAAGESEQKSFPPNSEWHTTLTLPPPEPLNGGTTAQCATVMSADSEFTHTRPGLSGPFSCITRKSLLGHSVPEENKTSAINLTVLLFHVMSCSPCFFDFEVPRS